MSFSDLRKEYDLISVAERHGVHLKGTGAKKWGVCPFPHHTHQKRPTASFSIYVYNGEQRFKCHGLCGAQGDVIDFFGYLYIAGYNPRDNVQKEEAGRMLGDGKVERHAPVIVETRELLPEFIWQDYLPLADNARHFLRSRGISDDVIDECRFGSASQLKEIDGRRSILRGSVDRLISLPTFHSGSLVGIKLRVLQARNGYKYFSHPGSRAGLWGHDRVWNYTGPVLIAKGEICGGVMLTARFTACAITSGERGTTDRMELFPAIRSALALAKKVYIGDNDSTGRVHTVRLADLLDAVPRFPPENYKDWDQWYLADPQECVRITNLWLEEAARS